MLKTDSISYFLGVEGEQSGPFSKAQIEDKVNNGQISTDTLIWWQGQKDWISIVEFKKSHLLITKDKKENLSRVLENKLDKVSLATFSNKNAAPEPVYEAEESSDAQFILYRFRFITLGIVFLSLSSLFYFIYHSSQNKIATVVSSKKINKVSLERQTQFNKALSELRLSPNESTVVLRKLIKENSTDIIAKEAIQSLTEYYKSLQKPAEAGRVLFEAGRFGDAFRFFIQDPTAYLEGEKASYKAFEVSTGLERYAYLKENIRYLVGPVGDMKKATERIFLLEKEFSKEGNPFRYYIKPIDLRISDIFSRVSFSYVQNFLSFLNVEMPQVQLVSRPLVEIRKNQKEGYRLIATYRGDVVLNQDRLKGIYFVFWHYQDSWVLVDTNLTNERKKFANSMKKKMMSKWISNSEMLTILENGFKNLFPKLALHEAVNPSRDFATENKNSPK